MHDFLPYSAELGLCTYWEFYSLGFQPDKMREMWEDVSEKLDQAAFIEA